MCEFLSTVNFESMKKFSGCLYNICIFLYSDYTCDLYVTWIFAEPQIYYLIFDNFKYSLACKPNYIYSKFHHYFPRMNYQKYI